MGPNPHFPIFFVQFALKSFAIFKGKTLCWSLFLDKVALLKTSQLRLICSTSTAETLEKGMKCALKINNKNIKTTPMALFWRFCRYLWTYFTPFDILTHISHVSIVDFKQVNVTWPALLKRDSNTGVSREYCEIFKSSFFIEHLRQLLLYIWAEQYLEPC